MGLISGIKSIFVRQFSIRNLPDDLVGNRGDAGEVVTDSNVMALSAVWGCVNLLSGTISTLPLLTYKRAGVERIIAPEHPLYRVLHDSPNYDQTAVDFWEFMQVSLELWGNAYARIERTAGKITALHPVSPALVLVRRLPNGEIEYSWTENGRNFQVKDRDLFHVRGFGGNPLGGLSTLQFGRNTFSLARAIDRAAGSTFQNGLRPSGVLTFENFLSEQNRAIARNQLGESFTGAMNAGRPMILEGGTKWEQITINPEDAQMLESRGFSIEEICRFFGVPPHMIGHMSQGQTGWGTGLEQQVLGFQKFALRRRLKRIEQAIAKQLFTDADRAAGVTVEFSLEGLLRGDSAARSAFYASGLMNGWMTINEVRALENLPGVSGGDLPRMQMQNVPITEAGKNDNAG